MPQSMERKQTLSAECPVDYVESRAVTLTHTTGVVAYTSAGAIPTGVTRGRANADSHNSTYTIEFEAIKTIDGSRWVELAAAVSQGDELEVIGTLGKFQTQSAGSASGLRAATDGVIGETIAAYNV